jgi:hypothetical protein
MDVFIFSCQKSYPDMVLFFTKIDKKTSIFFDTIYKNYWYILSWNTLLKKTQKIPKLSFF